MGKVNIKQLNFAPDTGYVIGSGAGGVPIWKLEVASVAWNQITGNQADINLSGFTNDAGFITGNQIITLSGDVTGSGTTGITTTIGNNVVSNAKIRQSVGLSVIGRSAATTGNVADIVSTGGQVLRNDGSTLAFGSLNLGYFAGLALSQVVYSSGAGNLTQSASFTYNGTTLSVSSGSISSSAGFQINLSATSGHFLRGNGTNFVSSLIQASDISTAGGLTGTLTTGYIPKAASASSLTNSLLFETGQTVAVGTNNAIDAFTRFYVFGGTNGANLDVRPGGGGYNQAIVDLQSDDFANNFQSTYLVHYGTGALGTTLGTTNVELGLLQFGGAGAAINSIASLQIGIGGTEKLRVTSTGVAIGTTSISAGSLLDVNGVINSATGFRIANAAATGQYLRGNGTNFVSSALTASDLASNSITDGLMRQSAGLSVIGRSANSTGNVADITAGTDLHVLRRSGTSIGFGLLTLGSISATNNQLFYGVGGVAGQSANMTYDGSNFGITANSIFTGQFSSVSNITNGVNYSGTSTATAAGAYGVRYNHTLTASNTVNHDLTGVRFTNTLIAAANNNFLYGAVIDPTFTNGAFTNVQNVPLQVMERTTGAQTIRIQHAAAGNTGGLTINDSGNVSRTSLAYVGANGSSYIVMAGATNNYFNFSNNALSIQAAFSTIASWSTSGQLRLGTSATAASAKFEIQSTTQGFLPPRMTATQGSAISSPAEGLMIYVTDTNGTFTSKGFWGYTGAAWEKLNN